MAEAVPLRRVLECKEHDVVAHDVSVERVVDGERHVVARSVLGARRREDRRGTARVQHCASRVVEREAQAERAAFADLGGALLDLLGRDEVQAPDLVVGAEVSPGRSVGPPRPS